MSEKPIHEGLEQKLKESENIAAESKQTETESLSDKNMESFPFKTFIWPVYHWLPKIQ